MPPRHHIHQARLLGVLGCLVLVLAAVGWRLWDIAWRRHDWYAQTAAAQAAGAANILVRGNIFMADGSGHDFLVATTRKFPTVIADLATVDAPEAAHALAPVLGADTAELEEDLHGDGATRVIARRLTDEQASAVKALNIRGITVGAETDRSYPAGTLAADTVGFLGYGESGRAGQYGVEAMYDGDLSGRAAAAVTARWDLFGRLGALFGRPGPESDATAARPADLELTLDKNIQAYTEGVLDALLKRYRAASGTIIVQEPSTGRLLAVADSPSFDPNRYRFAPVAAFLNGALVPFEPGSSFKPITMAAGLEAKVITPQSVFNDDGDVVVDGYTIKNFNEQHFGRVTMSKILEKSINTGTMHVQTLTGNDRFLRFVENAGFGMKTGVDLPGESPGNLQNLYTGRRINFLTASFGQGITVTPLQLVNAYSAIANGGRLMRPYVVASLRTDDGRRSDTSPEVVGTPFSAGTAAMLRQMLVSVVDNGFDKARIPRYDVAGKTGTAQIASPDGGYLEGQYNHSFVGFAPASNPRFTVLIKMEKPQGITFAADSLSPVFKDISLFLLNYLNVPPTR